LLKSTDGFAAAQFGVSTDIPTPADFDGDGKTDVSVFRPDEGNWYRIKQRKRAVCQRILRDKRRQTRSGGFRSIRNN
jgi:hypothetical protein